MMDPNKEFGETKISGTVRNFYYDTTVLITGGTGFLGKAIIEKLLRSFGDIRCIYIVIRGKSKESVEQRHTKLMNNKIFDIIRNQWPERLEKIKPIEGDVAKQDLGISIQHQKILEEVDIVLHTAATVNFQDSFKNALTVNTIGTKNILELCHKMKRLKSIVHISTAYTNCDKKCEMEETIYPSNIDPNALIQCASLLPQELFDCMSPKMQGGYPNSYTFTKAIAEQIVQKYGTGLPICIVRPSIVTAAYKEPYPGWIDNLMGPTRLTQEIYRGTSRSMFGNRNVVMDLIPIDVVVNTCITAAWHSTHKPTDLVIYNCTSGSLNPLTYNSFINLVMKHARSSPTNHVKVYPNISITNSRLINGFWTMVVYYIPFLVFDVIMKAKGKNPIMIKIMKQVNTMYKVTEFFVRNEFKFKILNMVSLMKALRDTSEDGEFYCDVSNIDWNSYMKNYILGIRKFLLKDPIDTMPSAKRKLQILYWSQKILQILVAYFIFLFIISNIF